MRIHLKITRKEKKNQKKIIHFDRESAKIYLKKKQNRTNEQTATITKKSNIKKKIQQEITKVNNKQQQLK